MDLAAEVEKHHEDLARWLGSEAEPALLDSIRAAHRPEFTLVAIDGAKLDLDGLLTGLAGARNAVPGLTIGIEEFEVVVRTAEVAVCRFLERHSVGSLRRTVVVLTADPAGRNGVRWLSVQETPVL
ncbi:hypothetical protein EV138_0179 [Kribbella voronezhensis]|uniref:DUF4440 domain-containing protein n=1 Tax=Kribbella voronezhensis TaxID=2512212 RepID=A0A4R7T4V9_9ACTN|nr:hypothetical protein [Kribbella voronezhensis]TDU86665.1 hypothetical protein EV138_0179 [Kribbella voronezhensis]